MTQKVFIDTEFTDFYDTHLISIGMVADSGEEFYAEVPYPDKSCSAFVREVVIPLLGGIPHASFKHEDLYLEITKWLRIIRRGNQEIEICFDFQMDWELFVLALDNRIPRWCRARLIDKEIEEWLLYDFFEKNKLPEHHALYDARANCYAFREKTFPSD